MMVALQTVNHACRCWMLRSSGVETPGVTTGRPRWTKAMEDFGHGKLKLTVHAAK